MDWHRWSSKVESHGNVVQRSRFLLMLREGTDVMARRTIVATALLLIALVVQGGILASHLGRRDDEAPYRTVEIGQHMPLITGLRPDGELDTVRIGETALPGMMLLAFSVTCVYCRELAPYWKQWLAEHPTTAVVALTLDPPRRASEWLLEQQLAVAFLSVSPTPVTDLSQVIARTPWYFVLDRNGILVAQGHGSQLPGTLDSFERMAR